MIVVNFVGDNRRYRLGLYLVQEVRKLDLQFCKEITCTSGRENAEANSLHR